MPEHAGHGDVMPEHAGHGDVMPEHAGHSELRTGGAVMGAAVRQRQEM
ncbi:hypothetical protein MX572_03955 [Rhodococcus pyridinivorans]|nr:hypothetical protein [Rhodococcus pyridinivorans]UTM37974.1 hypothetical protein MX572_03955 [Rhodococcus pyridinivorans]